MVNCGSRCTLLLSAICQVSALMNTGCVDKYAGNSTIDCGVALFDNFDVRVTANSARTTYMFFCATSHTLAVLALCKYR